MDTMPSPAIRLEPTEIANDTFVVHAHRTDGALVVPVNSLVIRSLQPVVVDTGMAQHRDQYLDDVFGLVDADDLAWVIVSHDDPDHTGNVNELMSAAPNATLVIDWLMRLRMGPLLDVPGHRQRWVRDGDRIDVGDRTLSTVRPHVFDLPDTRGVFDPTTGVYWSADAFGTVLREPLPEVGGLAHDEWCDGMVTFDRHTAPWLGVVDARRFHAGVDAIDGLGATAIAGAHTPVITRHHVDAAVCAARSSIDDASRGVDEVAVGRIRQLLST